MKVLIVICLAVAAAAFPQVKSGISPNIVGGHEAIPHSAPHQVSFQQLLNGTKWDHVCGGSILAPNKIITAAHCIYPQDNISALRVVAGEHDFTESDGAEQAVGIAKMLYHPQYSKATADYDYGMLILAANLTFNKNVAPIRLPTSTDFVPSGRCKTTGWGTLNGDGESGYPTKLQEVTLPLVDQRVCKDAYADFVYHVTERMLCAGETGKSPCMGDSGSPLVCNDVLTGLASWNIVEGTSLQHPCGYAGYPTVFSHVAKALDWLAAQ